MAAETVLQETRVASALTTHMEEALQNIPENYKEMAKDIMMVAPTQLDTSTTRCVDPRDQATQADEQEIDEAKRPQYRPNAVARPGGDFGYIMVLLGADDTLSANDAVDIVKSWRKSTGGIFTMHGADQAHGGTGCGHIDNCVKGAADFGVQTQRVSDALNYIQGLHATDPHNYPLLTGQHVEKGVLVVDGDDTTIPSTINDTQYFRYDKRADEKNLLSLRNYMQSQGQAQVDDSYLSKMQSASDKQMTAVLSLLAKNLPVFAVTMENPAKGTPRSVTYQMTIPA